VLDIVLGQGMTAQWVMGGGISSPLRLSVAISNGSKWNEITAKTQYYIFNSMSIYFGS
jgi:hypothetical protein